MTGLVAAWLGLAGAALADGITNSGSDLRTGWYPDEGSITPQIVSATSTFGQLWSASVDGQVYAQPLLSPNGTLIVATENDKVYGLDPATGAQNWMTDLGTPFNPNDPNDPNNLACPDISPSVGITSTPVIDPSTNTVYLTHKNELPGYGAAWYMDALDVTTGKERTGFPVSLGGYDDTNTIFFFPRTQQQRAGLLLMNGVVYAAFGAHCDVPHWQGWVFGVRTSDGHVTAKWVDNTINNGGGIWQGGTGLASDGAGRILFATGNADTSTSTPTPGNTPPAVLADSAVRLQVNQQNGSLAPSDFFEPYNDAQLEQVDGDLGSGAVVVLPDQYFGTPTVPHLAVVDGKGGTLYLLNRDHLGGFKQGPGQTDAVVQTEPARGTVYGRAGVWPGDGGYVYVPTAGGSIANPSFGYLDVYRYGVDGSGMPSLSLVPPPPTADVLGWGSGSPVITSDGTTSGSALVWIIYAADRSGAGGELRAYDPVPVGGQLSLRFRAPIGTATGYSTPGVGGGRLYVGTRDGKVLGFGPTPGHLQISSQAIDFGAVPVGTAASESFTLSNTGGTTITITGSTPPTGGGFAAGTALPAGTTIKSGQTLTESVTFTPTSAGPASGTWQIITDDGSGPQQVNFTGTGTSSAGSPPAGGPPPLAKPAVVPAAPKFLPTVATTRMLMHVYITYRATAAATSHFVLERAAAGRRGSHGCVALTARNRSLAKCTRYILAAVFTHHDRVGANKLRLASYVPIRKLVPGIYRLRSVLLDSARAKHTFRSAFRIIVAPRSRHPKIAAPVAVSFERFLFELPSLVARSLL